MLGSFFKGHVLRSITEDGAVFIHRYDSGIIIEREQLYPFARINKPNKLFRIPFTRKYLLPNEYYSVLLIVVTLLIIQALGLPFVQIWMSILFNIFTVLAICYGGGLLSLDIVLNGIGVQGIVESFENYENEGGDDKANYSVKIPDGRSIQVKDKQRDVLSVGESVDIRMHASGVDFGDFKPSAIVELCIWILLYLCSVYSIYAFEEIGYWID
ncbi:MAG: hypothetical protein KA408_12320 [Flavobacteriales bacterium]|nr:hypothetical protein [Flavobacteriales bacterium]